MEKACDVLHLTADLAFDLSRQKQSTESLRQHLAKITPHFGASYFLFGLRGTISGTNEAVQLGITNAPASFQAYYDNSGAFGYDPLIRRTVTGRGPFRWEDVFHANDKQKALLAERVKCGMGFGFSCSAPQEGFLGILNFAGRERLADDKWERAAFALEQLATAFTRSGVAILEARHASSKRVVEALTPTEVSVLELSAQGLTAAEVGTKLNITQHTVRYHLDQAAQKLGVTRREVVTEALHLGLIRKRHFDVDPRFADCVGGEAPQNSIAKG
jgi:DNA-binding CsgD family transcriptional regulator